MTPTKGYTDWPVTIALPFEHRCKDCVEYDPQFNITREAKWREMISDFLHGETIRSKRVIKSKPNFCFKHTKQVHPLAKEPCFEWCGSHEEWYPEIEATIIDGKLKVIFQ